MRWISYLEGVHQLEERYRLQWNGQDNGYNWYGVGVWW